MKRYSLIIFALLSIAKAFSQNVEPTKQDTTLSNYQFTLKDGTILVGILVDQNKESYIIKTINFGIIKIDSNQVMSIILQDQKISKARTSSSGYYGNQFGFKYFLFPTAIPVEKNKWYYTNQYIAFSSFTYGINKRVSAGFTFFTFVPTSFLLPALKVTLNPNSKTKFAISGQYLYIRGNSNSNLGLVQAIITSGDAHNNFTLGVGKFISNRVTNDGAIVTFGFVKKVSPKLTAISENSILIGSNSNTTPFGLLSVGLRFDRRTHSFDLGLLAPTSWLDRNIYLIPYLGFNLRLTK
jgi:hypothetical protein